MKTISVDELLSDVDDDRDNLGERRTMAGSTYHTILQVIADGPFPPEVRTSLPKARSFEDASSAELLVWWAKFRGWLSQLRPDQRDWLGKQIVNW